MVQAAVQNKNVKRRWFFGLIGPRYCMLANPKDWRIHCDFRVEHDFIKVSYIRWPIIKKIPTPPKPPVPATIKRNWFKFVKIF